MYPAWCHGITYIHEFFANYITPAWALISMINSHGLTFAVHNITFDVSRDLSTLGPFIRGKIRRELYHLYEHVLSKMRTARINGSRLISVLDLFSCECCL